MNSLVPTGPTTPSQRDIAEMARLRAIMEGKSVPAIQDPIQAHYVGGRAPLREAYVPPVYNGGGSPSREDVDAMKTLLEKLNHLSGEETPPTRQLTERTVTPTQSLNTGTYEVLVMLKESASGKETKSYNVVDQNRQDIVSDIMIKEAAQSIAKLMNKGLTLQSPKVQEILDLEEDYNRNRIEASKHKARFQRSSELGESAAANVFKERFGVAKANALAAQDQIKSIFESIR